MSLTMQLVHFIFSTFWTWLGAMLLLIVIFLGIAEILKAIRGSGAGTINVGLNGAVSGVLGALDTAAKALTPKGGEKR